MAAVEQVQLPLSCSPHISLSLRIALLPRHSREAVPAFLTDEPTSFEDDDAPRVQVLEGEEYRYEVLGDVAGVINLEPKEMFQADATDGRTGRLRTGTYTGTLSVIASLSNVRIGECSVEVRSRKLDYRSEYRWMLRDIACAMTEILMNRFAPSAQRFAPDDARDAVTLYERFAFLKSLITSDNFAAALHRVIRQPYVSFQALEEERRPQRGFPAKSGLARQLGRPGARVSWPRGRISSLPTRVRINRTEATVDNTPNRFIRFVLNRWRTVLAQMLDALLREQQKPAAARGVSEARGVLEKLDSLLAEEVFRELGPLTRFPADDQVLLKREGYRDVLLAYLQFEAAAQLRWEGGREVYGAGQRDVATLYEYWVFLQLSLAISNVLEVPFKFEALLQLDKSGVNIRIRRGATTVLEGTAYRFGRPLRVEFRYNPIYAASASGQSWTVQMRPDFSLRITPLEPESAGNTTVLVHFDAKYRLNSVEEIFATDDVAEREQAGDAERDDFKRDDLLKMHAYRDAIKRSVGAYVIYPGTQQKVLTEFHELLPGLGAFALRPSASDGPHGIGAVQTFINDAIEHVGLQITQDERARFWRTRVFQDAPLEGMPKVPVASFLSAPPADTQVLLAYVKDERHWRWIEETNFYNLRAYERRGAVALGSRELSCEFLVLSCPACDKAALAHITGQPYVLTAEHMRGLGYTDPRGNYFCLPIAFSPDAIWDKLFEARKIETIRSEYVAAPGQPVVLSWLELSVALLEL